ncbi:uncharacterized protein SCHCODRAFT_02584257 [Schizophyllum commune H4-8]|uniref:uncharacterized protein n=1 Tax=Schizophyllum commune (strain H4-8 / FGSC 9210) TaxID=578458 RepID=UPI00215EBFAF|nr:uncharacterized protein SCHCODRAFT_02584257 [Schizophyllum commune H4-8]KAI5890730.1 hypothetical protein SCHCODRAFT_02584257 [Schizophyllum commune H4-8]
MADSILSLFELFAMSNDLTPESGEYNVAQAGFLTNATHDAYTAFEDSFGSDDNDLDAWRNICRTGGIRNAESLPSITACKKAIRQSNINIYDLEDAMKSNTTCSGYATRAQLRQSIRKGKRYPKKRAKENRLLKAFLLVSGEDY